ncbi:YIP1 family protein [Halodurantibacterium flavum]|uniref:YIP1 family protein n=1 Tax=Halodurantibacterium flavum TaxID=1382802 RepID=A0ABW4S433_9RHOB
MELSLSGVIGLLRATLADPQTTARQLIAMPLPMAARWQALILVVVLSVLLLQLALFIAGGVAAAGEGMVQSALLQGGVLVVTVFAIHRIGRAFGGTGDLGGALILMAWLQFVTLCFQAVQIVTLLLVPPMASIVAIVSVAVFLWLLVTFVQVLHGFRSRLMVMFGLVGSFFALAFALSFILVLLGIPIPGGFDDL